jgi:membrane-associated phospholipid phosphatase
MQRKIIFAAGIAIGLAASSSAHAVCLPNVLPQFTVSVQANAFMQNDCEPIGFQLSASGPSLVGNADATGTAAAVGNLNAIAHTDYFLAQRNGQFSTSGAQVGFSDRFFFLIPGVPGTGSDTLAFTLQLSGATGIVGNPADFTGSVTAQLDADSPGDLGEVAFLTAPGTAVLNLAVLIGIDNRVDLDGLLSISASAGGPGNVTVDFSDTFAVTKLQLFDSSGNLLQENVMLTDASGNVLGAPSNPPPPPPPPVPEPSSALLLAAGLGLLGCVLRHVRPPLIAASMLLVAIGAGRAEDQIEPNAGNWKTWVISSGRDFRTPPPPGEAAATAEIAELKALAKQRDATAKDLIAYWDVGPPSYRWQEIALDEALRNSMPWGYAIRGFALMHAAIYDAMVAAWDSKYAYQRKRPSEADAGLVTALPNPLSPSYPAEHAVAAGAAATLLSYLFPDRAAYFVGKAEEAGRSRLLAGVHYPSDVAAGLELGRKVAMLVIERGKADGSDAKWTGNVPAGPGKWNGTNPILPQMAMWKTWVLDSPSEFRSPPPPAYDSSEKAAELAEIKNFPRTPKTNTAAFFWEYAVGGLRFHQYWAGQIGRLVLENRLDNDPPLAARAYALQNIATTDAGIACWDGKYAYWAIRPFQLDPEVKPLFPTPNHPSYPAAHGCASTAEAAILGYLFPRDAAALAALAEEAAESRVWAGIHYRSDIIAGKALGRAVAEKVIVRTQKDGS